MENFKNRIGIPITLEFGLDSINFKDNIVAGSINATKVASLIETKDHFFVKLVTDTSFIIPKKEVLHPTAFKTHLTNMGAQYVDELQWQWQ